MEAESRDATVDDVAWLWIAIEEAVAADLVLSRRKRRAGVNVAGRDLLGHRPRLKTSLPHQGSTGKRRLLLHCEFSNPFIRVEQNRRGLAHAKEGEEAS